MLKGSVAAFLVALALAAPAAARPARASWYGPGLYGNPLACGGTLTPSTWGVAHRTLPCGSVVSVCYRARCYRAPVVDRGPFVAGRDVDLTGPVARALCRCRDWGVRTVALY